MKTGTDWQFASSADAPRPGRVSLLIARAGNGLALLNLLVAVAAPVAALYLDIPELTAFRVFFFALALGLFLGLAGLLFAMITALMKQSPWKSGLLMLLLGILPLAAVMTTLGPATMLLPMIHDISTDTDDPPEFVEAKRLRKAGENTLEYGGAEIAAKQHTAYPHIQPIITPLDRDEALAEATQTAKDLGWEFINVDYGQGIIEAYDTTRIFRFVDDIVIRVRPEGKGSRVDIRSVSRLGLSDLGKNARRIDTFRKTFRG